MKNEKKMRKSTQVALGGLASSLCLVLMFMTGLFPFATYALPAMAGIILIIIVIENGPSTAWLVYAAVSMLSMFVVPDKEAALIFIAFFGYYPILKQAIEKNIKFKPFQIILKFLTFNTAIITMYTILIKFIGASEAIAEMGALGTAGAILLLVLGNITFVIYDFALTLLITVYFKVLRKKIIKHI